MIKISITGKARSGKNTLAKLLVKELHAVWKNTNALGSYKFIAFADPIKEMARLAFPKIPRKWLYGSSEYRDEIIPGAFKNGCPLTVRQLLIDLGNDFGRQYQSDIWIYNFDNRFNSLVQKGYDIVIATDCRFRSE